MRRIGMSKEDFREWILACCDTFMRNEDKLYNMYRDHTTSMDIIFPIRVDEVASMEIVVNKTVMNEENKIVVIKNLEDKENEND